MRKNILLTFLVALLGSWLTTASAAELNWTTVPANGSTVRVLESIQFQFEGAKSVSLSDSAEDGWLTATLNGEASKAPTVGNNGMLSMRGITLTDGTYVLNAHEGLFSVTLNDGTVQPSPAMTVTYTIDANAIVNHDVSVTYTPAAGAQVYSVGKVKVTFDSDMFEDVAFGDNITADGFTVTVGSTVYKYGTDFTEGDDITEMVFETPITTKGEVKVKVAEGFYTLNFTDGMSQPSPACEWSFSVIEQPWDPNITFVTSPTLNQQIAEMKEIKVTYSGNGLTEVMFGDNITPDSYTVTLGSNVYKYGTDFTEGDDITTMVFNTPVSTKGYPKVKIAEGFYTLKFENGETRPSPAAEWSFQTIGKTTIPVINPAEGVITDPLLFNNITMTMQPGITLGNVSTLTNKVYLYKVADDGTETQVVQYNGKKTDATLATFTPKTAITEDLEPGNYRFKLLKAGALTMTENGVQVVLGQLEYNYTLKEPVVYPAIDPAEGLVTDFKKFEKITLTMPADDMIVGSFSLYTKKAILYKVNDDGTETQIIRYNKGTKDANDKRIAIFETNNAFPESMANGNYRFWIQKGALTVTRNGAKVFDEDLSYNFTLEQTAVAPAVKWTITPAEGSTVEELTEFSVAFEGVTEVAFGDNVTTQSVILTQGSKTLSYAEGILEGDEITTMVLDEPLTTAGEVTVNFAEGFYSLTLADGSTIPSPAMQGKFTVTPKGDDTVHYTVTPAQDANVKTLSEFSVAFQGVKEVAFSDNISASSVTLKQGDKTYTYTNGFFESDDEITTMVLDEPVKTAGVAEVTFAEGAYTLTMNDGTTKPSPEVKWSFNIEGDPLAGIVYSISPKDGETISKLESFSTSVTGAPADFESTAGNPDAAVTVKYGDKTISLNNGITVDGDKFVLDNPIAEDCTATITIGEGYYNWTINGQSIASPEVTSTVNIVAVAEGDPVWVPVRNLTELDALQGKDMVLAWYYKGSFQVNTAPERRMAPPIENGKMDCVVMNTEQTLGGNGYIGYRGATTMKPVVDDNKSFRGVVDLPENAAILRFAKTDEGYTIYNTNIETPGYICPMENMDMNRNYLSTSQTPWYNTISISNGVTHITEKTRDDKNVLSATTQWMMGADSQCVFMYISQELDLGGMYILVRASDKANVSVVADPESGSVIAAPQQAAEGKELGAVEVKFTFEGADQALYDASKALTATFDGVALAADQIECDQANPAVVKFYVPVNKGGKLVAEIPEGWYTLTAGGETVPSPAVTYELTLTEVLKVLDVEIGITPETGSKVTEISEIVVKMPQGVAYEINPAMYDDDAVPMNVTINGEQTSLPVMVDETHFRYRPEYNTAGTYVLTLAEGLYILTLEDGTKGLSPEAQTIVEIDPTGVVLDVEYTTTPANRATVEGELTEFAVKFDGVTEVAFGPAADADGLSVTIGDKTMHYADEFAEGDEITTMVFNEPQTASDTTVMIDFAEGFYLLTLEDGTVGQSPAVHFSFTLTDVNSIALIFGEDFNGDVYTVSGICVLRDATADDLKTLTPGLYIIKGRTVMVR